MPHSEVFLPRQEEEPNQGKWVDANELLESYAQVRAEAATEDPREVSMDVAAGRSDQIKQNVQGMKLKRKK